MHLQELVALLPDDASVQRHFDQPGPGQKVPPFVIARRVTSSEFGALLDLIATREEPPIYLKDLDLDADGTLQVSLMQPIAIPEMASIWHDCVSEAIVAHMREGLCQAGLSPDALVPFGGARYPSAICGVRMATGVQIGRKPNGNRDWPESNRDRHSGTFLVEVAFSEDPPHLRRKIESTWMNAKGGIFPLLLLSVDFVCCGSEQSLLEEVPICLHVCLYRRRILDGDEGLEILQSLHVGPDSGCTSAGLPNPPPFKGAPVWPDKRSTRPMHRRLH